MVALGGQWDRSGLRSQAMRRRWAPSAVIVVTVAIIVVIGRAAIPRVTAVRT